MSVDVRVKVGTTTRTPVVASDRIFDTPSTVDQARNISFRTYYTFKNILRDDYLTALAPVSLLPGRSDGIDVPEGIAVDG
jgi:ASC-1-like (ASCH) protein